MDKLFSISAFIIASLALFFPASGKGSAWCGFPPGPITFTANAHQPFRQELRFALIDPTIDTVFQSEDLPAWLSLDRNGVLSGTAPATHGSEAFHLTAVCEDDSDESHPAAIVVQ